MSNERPDQNIAAVDLNRKVSNESPKQPNEHDEKVGSTSGQPNETVAQGKRDLDRGLVDTSRAEATQSTYDKQK